MGAKRTNIRRWPCLEFSLLDVTNPEAVADFIVWLCTGHFADDWKHIDEAQDSTQEEDLVETLWSWDNAPRKRMAKLLWQLLVRNDRREHFSQFFTIDQVWLTRQANESAKILAPIHKRLRWVLDGFIERQREDVFIGQGRWGEEWLLPPKHAAYVRRQLRRARPELLQEASNYEDSLRYFNPPYFEQPCGDYGRRYVGEHRKYGGAQVWIEGRRGRQYPLRHARFPFGQEPGTNFSWGYCGSGPAELSESILADATGGDLEIARQLRIAFRDEIISSIPWTGNFDLSLQSALEWLRIKGIGKRELHESAAKVHDLQAQFGDKIDQHKKLLKQIRQMGGLLAQRFDIVPKDFESALYVDLMQMFERAGSILRCTRCRQPVPCDRSPRGNRQRARWRAGKPIYHEKCFAEHRREHKRDYWQQLSNSPSFRAKERERGRKRRKHKVVLGSI